MPECMNVEIGMLTHSNCVKNKNVHKNSYDVKYSYEATHWERSQFIEFISPVRRYEKNTTQMSVISYILHIISLLTGDMNSINWLRSQCVAS